jgi:hypothetical protein
MEIRPNPVRSIARIIVRGLGSQTEGQLGIYTLQGRRIGLQPLAGNGIVWNAKELPAGIYLIKVRAGDREWSKRVLLLK